MSYKDDASAHKNDEAQRAYVASTLGLDPSQLADHPFEIEEDMQQGEVTSWSVHWQDGAPEGVDTEGRASTIWTTIPAPSRGHDPDDD